MNNTIECDLPSTASITVGTILTVGIILSYIPQIYIVLKNKSIAGISYETILLSNISSLCNLLGVIFIMYDKFWCCSIVSNKHCMQIIMPVIQMCAPMIAQVSLLFMFVVWKKKDFITYQANRYYNNTIKGYVIISLLFTIIGLILSKYNKNVVYGNVLDTISSILTCFLFIPQIKHTYILKTSGNFSLIMLSLQMPGAFAIFVYQSILSKTSITTGLSYLISGIEQLILFVLCIYYDYFYNRYLNIGDKKTLIVKF